MTRRNQLLRDFLVAREALHLEERALVPVQAEPAACSRGSRSPRPRSSARGRCPRCAGRTCRRGAARRPRRTARCARRRCAGSRSGWARSGCGRSLAHASRCRLRPAGAGARQRSMPPARLATFAKPAFLQHHGRLRRARARAADHDDRVCPCRFRAVLLDQASQRNQLRSLDVPERAVEFVRLAHVDDLHARRSSPPASRAAVPRCRRRCRKAAPSRCRRCSSCLPFRAGRSAGSPAPPPPSVSGAARPRCVM